jgi:hypothetical protein
MADLSVVLEIGQDEGLSVRFTIRLNGDRIAFFNIFEKDIKQKRGYRDFVNGKQDLLNFSDSKGCVTMTRSTNTMVRCGVTKMCESGDGEIVFFLPFDIMKEPLTRLADLLEPETDDTK